MKFDTNKLSWLNKPEEFSIDADRITITTEAETDLWQRTFYNGQADNAPMLLMNTDERRFTFSAKAEMKGDFGAYDQCGLVIYLDSDNWLKVSCEYEKPNQLHLGSVHTTHGYSDWATTTVSSESYAMWYRISRKDDDYVVESSADGENYTVMRMLHMFEGAGEIRFGLYACSPDESSFEAVFSEMEMKEFDTDAF